MRSLGVSIEIEDYFHENGSSPLSLAHVGSGLAMGWPGKLAGKYGVNSLAGATADSHSSLRQNRQEVAGEDQPRICIPGKSRRFAVANSGGHVDRNLVSWLLGRDYGKDLRMGPLNIDGIKNSAGLQLRTQNHLPWLDLWYGEPGSATQYLGGHQVGEDTVIILDN